MTAITHLNLYGSYLTTNLELVFLLSTLGELNLGKCNLKAIPDTVCHLTNLRFLYLHQNHLKSLPSSITKCHKLERISLWGNNDIESRLEPLLHLPHLVYIDINLKNYDKIPEELIKNQNIFIKKL